MGYPRHVYVPPDTPGTYHCVSRCVRRAFLCGEDPLTRRSFEHRRQWMEERILELPKVFAMAVHAYAVMSNHFHVVVETDPSAPWQWSDMEVATRWLALSSDTKDPQHPLQTRIEALAAQPERMQELRERLGSLSWFMRYLKEPIARKANKEDECTGHFWEGRFRTQALLDDCAVIASMVYVDLNPIRAGMAQTPEESLHTSIRRRINQLEQHHQALRPLSSSIDSQLYGDSVEQYLELVDWSGRALHSNNKGSIPKHTPQILQRLNLRPRQWLTQVPATESQFWRVIGGTEAMLELAQETGRKWIRGIGMARRLQTQA